MILIWNLARLPFCTMIEIPWGKFPLVNGQEHAHRWLQYYADIGRAQNTIVAYGRALDDHLRILAKADTAPLVAGVDVVAAWIGDMLSRPNPHGPRRPTRRRGDSVRPDTKRTRHRHGLHSAHRPAREPPGGPSVTRPRPTENRAPRAAEQGELHAAFLLPFNQDSARMHVYSAESDGRHRSKRFTGPAGRASAQSDSA